MLEFLGLDVDAFHAAVSCHPPPIDEVLAWVQANMAERSDDEIAAAGTK